MTGHGDSRSSVPDGQRGPLSPEQIRLDIATILDLDPSEIRDDDELIDLGMDSVRLMSLVQKWRDQGARVEFPDLAERPEVGAWIALLAPP